MPYAFNPDGTPVWYNPGQSPPPGTTGNPPAATPPADAGSAAPPAAATPADTPAPPDPVAAQLAQQAEEAKTQQRQNAMDQLKNLFNQYGLADLSTWAWGELQAGKSMDNILLEMYDQKTFKDRYPMYDAMRQAGLAVPTVAEVNRIQNEYKRLQVAYGHQPSKNPSDYLDLFVNQVSPAEFEKRLDNYDKLRNTYGPHMRANFEQLAGMGDVSDEQLYQLLSGQNHSLAHTYAQQTGNPVQTISFEDIERSFVQAQEQEKAYTKTGGESVGGIGTAREEAQLRERQVAI